MSLSPRAGLEKLLTRLSQALSLAEGLTEEKSLKFEPWGAVFVLAPDGGWKIVLPSEWHGSAHATLTWRSEQWAKMTQGAVAGLWPFSPKEGVAVSGDIAWVMELYRRMRLVPWWWSSLAAKAGPLTHIAQWLAYRAIRKHPAAMFAVALATLHEIFMEDQMTVSRRFAASRFTAQLEALYDEVERMEARLHRLQALQKATSPTPATSTATAASQSRY